MEIKNISTNENTNTEREKVDVQDINLNFNMNEPKKASNVNDKKIGKTIFKYTFVLSIPVLAFLGITSYFNESPFDEKSPVLNKIMSDSERLNNLTDRNLTSTNKNIDDKLDNIQPLSVLQAKQQNIKVTKRKTNIKLKKELKEYSTSVKKEVLKKSTNKKIVRNNIKKTKKKPIKTVKVKKNVKSLFASVDSKKNVIDGASNGINYYIQIAVVPFPEKMSKTFKKIEKLGYTYKINKLNSKSGKSLNRILVGTFSDYKSAKSKLKFINKQLKVKGFVKKI